MKQQDITTGFQKVDNVEEDFFVRFIVDANQNPSVQECFKEQLNWLEIQQGQCILDVGCGIGDQALEMAKKVGASGKVFGTDLSETMIKIATARHAAAGLPLNYRVASATEQPFADETFDCIRAERVLMYVHDLPEAFKEFARLLKPEGKLLVFDFDWDALSIAHTNKALTRRIVEFVSDSFPNGRIGAELRSRFTETGFKEIKIKAMGYLTQVGFTRRIIGGAIANGVEKGVFGETEINEWWAHLEERDEKKTFLASSNGFIVMGRK